ncbi:MAG TPA: DUF4157 domain-containing protein [Pyrinomonadaceae bacterium]|jgi:hypothetical protein|nr:DUF4157 domain-containing protein [Pyrinomonadaceae bacterium]
MKVYAQKSGRPQQNVPLLPSLLTHHKIVNQTVSVSLRADAEGHNAVTDTSTAACFAHDFSRIPAHSKAQVGLQAKLVVNTPGDIYEQEADRISEEIANTPEPRQGHACACGGGCPSCRNGQDAHGRLQMKHVEANNPGGPAAPPIVHETLRSSGQPLDSATRDLMESRFGHDFSRVRLHTDAQAAESARAVNARAYTAGRHVVFGAGQFTTGTGAGRKLLAHELAHVVQQGDGDTGRLSRVPNEAGISEAHPRYSFSLNCGWIDWTHATPGLTINLITGVRRASDALRSAGTSATSSTGQFVSPRMSARVPHVGVVLSGATISVRLLRPLSADEVLSVALSIFKKLSIAFETQQEWTDFLGSSSFSQEDLVSNMISFYAAARRYNREQIEHYCRAFSREDSLWEYRRTREFRRNRSFMPVGATGPWPAELSNIDDSRASALYEILTISTRRGVATQDYCPIYRIEGPVNGTGISGEGATFTAADDLRVVPTYRFRQEVLDNAEVIGLIEVEPYRASDRAVFRRSGLSLPAFLPMNVLKCLSSRGNPG